VRVQLLVLFRVGASWTLVAVILIEEISPQQTRQEPMIHADFTESCLAEFLIQDTSGAPYTKTVTSDRQIQNKMFSHASTDV